MWIKAWIPNLLTLCNLACGLVCITLVFEHPGPDSMYSIAAWMCAAMVFDFFDGFAARMLRVGSPIGKELDSLADVVTFGVVPGLLVYQMLGAFYIHEETPLAYAKWIALLIPLMSAFRLAKFNVDERQHSGFHGLATPANALFFLSLYLMYHSPSQDEPMPAATGYVLIGLCLLFSFLMVSEIRLLAFKFKSLSFAQNWTRYIFLALTVTLIVSLRQFAVPIVMVLYFGFSFLHYQVLKRED